MQVNPDNRTFQGITTLLSFIALNVIYLLCCVPVVTIGVATSALYEVTFRYADEESGNLLKDYFVALKRNLVQASVVFLALAVPLALMVFAAVFWSSLNSTVSWAASALAGLAAAYLFAAILHGMALVASFHNTTRQTLKNAMLLPIVVPLRTLWIVLVPLTCFALMVVVPAFTFIVATLGFSVGAYGTAFLFRPVFRRFSEAGATD
ncbi:MAG: YesL family protein [Propionicimonas sp.]|uniref:DUF624 domain-containing protein n=1 Tax=Propionicimonas sp. TaxID=1955623 RepID=UPI003D099C70